MSDPTITEALDAGGATVTLSAVQVDNVRTVWRAAHPGEDDPPLSEALAAMLPHRSVLGGRILTGSFWADCPEIEREPEGRPVFKGTPVALASFFAVLAGDRTVADFLDAVPRHVTGEQVDAVLTWLVEQCGHRLVYVNDPADADPPPKERNLAADEEAER